jgi:hypothetical protein
VNDAIFLPKDFHVDARPAGNWRAGASETTVEVLISVARADVMKDAGNRAAYMVIEALS